MVSQTRNEASVVELGDRAQPVRMEAGATSGFYRTVGPDGIELTGA